MSKPTFSLVAVDGSKRTCAKCKVEKDLSEFSIRKDAKCKYRSWCKTCINQSAKSKLDKNNDSRELQRLYSREWQKKNEQNKIWYQNNKLKMRGAVLKKKYRITLEDYNLMLIEQNFSCAICEKHQSFFTRALAVDHCHKTGIIRGLLCFHCNHAIGKLEDSTDLLSKAIIYLNRFKNA